MAAQKVGQKVNQKVVEYFRQHMGRFSIEILRQKLLQYGHTEADVDKAIALAKEQGETVPPERQRKLMIFTVIAALVIASGLFLISPFPEREEGGPIIANRLPEQKIGCEEYIDALRKISHAMDDHDHLLLEKYADLYMETCETDWYSWPVDEACGIEHSALENDNEYCSHYRLQFQDIDDPRFAAFEGGSMFAMTSDESCQRLIENNDASKRKRMREYCYLTKALLEQDESYCDFLTEQFSPVDEGRCRAAVKSLGSCEGLADPALTNECRSLQASRQRDRLLCSPMQDVVDDEGRIIISSRAAVTQCEQEIDSLQQAYDELSLRNEPRCIPSKDSFECLGTSIQEQQLLLSFRHTLSKDIIPLSIRMTGDVRKSCSITPEQDTLWKRGETITIDLDCDMQPELPFYVFRVNMNYYNVDSSPLFSRSSAFEIVIRMEE